MNTHAHTLLHLYTTDIFVTIRPWNDNVVGSEFFFTKVYIIMNYINIITK